MKSQKSILLLSGGLDSGALLFWALSQGIDVLPLIVNYGQVTFPGEWQSVKFLINSTGLSSIKPLHIPKIASLGSGTLVTRIDENPPNDQYFPSRNLLLITIAAMYAYKKNASSIYIGLIADTAEILPDCSLYFLKKAQQVIQVEYPNLRLEAPFITRSKLDVVSEALKRGFIPENTFCCNRLPDHHCWSCPSCLDRLRTLKSLNRI